MQQRRFEFILEARQPISHAQENLGNTSVIMRQKVIRRDGTAAQVPIVTGDTMRHGLREAATYCLLECAGMLGENLSESALRLLFAGGMITSSGPTVDLEEYRRMVDIIPSLALLGGCAGNRVIPGQMQVEPALLICEETSHLLPPWVHEWIAGPTTGAHAGTLAPAKLGSSRGQIEEVQRVRMDPALDPAKRLLMLPGERARVEQRMLASEAASASEDHRLADASKSTMMPFRYERVCQGAKFWWSVNATCYTDLHLDTLLVMVGAFLRNARVGGKRGTGHGWLWPLAAQDIKLANFSERMDTLELATMDKTIGQTFRAHVQDRADKLREFLGRCAA